MVESTIMTQVPAPRSGGLRNPIQRWARPWRRSSLAEREVARFVEAASQATRRDELHDRLIEHVQQWTGSPRVELRPIGAPHRIRVLASVPALDRPGRSVDVPLLVRGDRVGTLSLEVGPRGRLSDAQERGLRMLCDIAAMADRMLAREEQSRLSGSSADPEAARPRQFLQPFLGQLIRLARRRREPVTVLAIGLDQPTDEPPALERIARAVIGTIRESDLVVRDDPRTLVAVLPNSSAENAPWVAEAIVRAVADAEAVEGPSAISVSVGVATFPDNAREPGLLLDIALEAMRRAWRSGRGVVVVAQQEPRSPQIFRPGEPVHEASRAG